MASISAQDGTYLFCDTYQYRPIELMTMSRLAEIMDPTGIPKMTTRAACGFVETHSGISFPPYFHPSAESVQQLSSGANVSLRLGVVMLPAGRHDLYFLRREAGVDQIYFDTTTVPHSESQVRAHAAPKIKKKQRMFLKERSVFRLWREDTPGQLAKLLDYDFGRSKIKKFVKSQIERNDMYNLLLKYVAYIKEEFLVQTVRSAYPNISWIDFTSYCQQRGLLDRQVNFSVIDRLFIAVNVDIEGANTMDNLGRALCRYEFLEILVRIAGAKFKDTGIRKTYRESLELLLASMIDLNEPPAINEFRKTEIWTLPIDDLLRANLEGLRKVYSRYLLGQKRALGIQDVVQMLRKDCGINVSELDITKAYGFSKMSIINEVESFGMVRVTMILLRTVQADDV